MLRFRPHRYAIALCALMFAAPAMSREYLLVQKDRKFVLENSPVSTMSVKVGDTVSFQNSDPFIHNVFSESVPNDFDLGAFPTNVAESHTFTSPGEVEVKCAMHAEMRLKITVNSQ